MALSDKINTLIVKYVRRGLPSLETEFVAAYVQQELQELEKSITSLADASVQVTDREPERPRKGMVRFAVSPWNPLSNNFSGLVVYTGSAWANLSVLVGGNAFTSADESKLDAIETSATADQTAAQIKALLSGVTYAQIS